MLMRFGRVAALEPDEFARSFATNRTGISIERGHLPDGIPSSLGTFDLVCLFDVLEHVEDDVAALAAIRPLLNPCARIILTVPAHQWLYGLHDESLHHMRRYSRPKLEEVIAAAQYTTSQLSYFNSLLFPLALIARGVDRFRGQASGSSLPLQPINKLLTQIFAAEAFLVTRHLLPIGLSLLAVIESKTTQ
jgi:hypothetical protein